MSSFGDEDYKTEMEEELRYIIENNYNKSLDELNKEEVAQVMADIFKVLKYLTWSMDAK